MVKNPKKCTKNRFYEWNLTSVRSSNSRFVPSSVRLGQTISIPAWFDDIGIRGFQHFNRLNLKTICRKIRVKYFFLLAKHIIFELHRLSCRSLVARYRRTNKGHAHIPNSLLFESKFPLKSCSPILFRYFAEWPLRVNLWLYFILSYF